MSNNTLALMIIPMSTNPWVILTKLKTKCFLEILGNASKIIMEAHKQLIIMLYVYEFVLLKTVNRVIMFMMLKIWAFEWNVLGNTKQSQSPDLLICSGLTISQKNDTRLKWISNSCSHLPSSRDIDFFSSFIFLSFYHYYLIWYKWKSFNLYLHLYNNNFLHV